MHRLGHRNRKRNKQRKIIIISICSILLFMTVGYAAMNTNLEINAKGNVIKKTSLGEDLIKLAGVVESGDGLYKDSYEENVYTYRGGSPNNYVTFNNELWRIISVNTSDNTIKIIRNEILLDKPFDTCSNGRYDGQYCNDNSNGCNIYGSTSTLYDNNLNLITTLGREYNGTKYTLPNKESEISIYLNGEYYNGLDAEAKNMIKEDAVYKVGVLYYNNTSIIQDMEQVNATKWKGKVGLIDATEYIKASTYTNCLDINSAYFKNVCSNNNWMYLNDYWWTLTGYSMNISRISWFIINDGSMGTDMGVYSNLGVRPVVTLKAEVKITSGDGSQNNSYQLSIES